MELVPGRKARSLLAAGVVGLTVAAVALTSAGVAAAKAKEREEVVLVTAVRPTLVELSKTLHKGDIVSARDAYEAYDAKWNGMEVYINVRSLPMYQALELDLQNKIAAALRDTAPNAVATAAIADALIAKYDEAIAMVKSGAPLSPLFDDLAHLRGVRSDLRIVTAALNAGDYKRAEDAFARFDKGFPTIRGLVDLRSATAGKEIAGGIAIVKGGFAAKDTTVDALKPAVASLTSRVNYAVNLLNAAARNADLAKREPATADLDTTSALNDMRLNLAKSLTAWKANDFAGSSHAVQSASARLETIRPVLAAKNAEASLRATLATYATLAGAAGSATTVEAANKATVEAANIAEQAVVGQFWTTPQVKVYVKGLPKA